MRGPRKARRRWDVRSSGNYGHFCFCDMGREEKMGKNPEILR